MTKPLGVRTPLVGATTTLLGRSIALRKSPWITVIGIGSSVNHTHTSTSSSSKGIGASTLLMERLNSGSAMSLTPFKSRSIVSSIMSATRLASLTCARTPISSCTWKMTWASSPSSSKRRCMRTIASLTTKALYP
ncbi:hypothetical protein [Thermus phage TSP4]|nr:hypothetical protein [Thermus phage TSP4]